MPRSVRNLFLSPARLAVVAALASVSLMAGCSESDSENQVGEPPVAQQAPTPPPHRTEMAQANETEPSSPAYNAGAAPADVPAQAQAAGFTQNTFSTRLKFNPGTVDSGLTYQPGYQWYVWNYFGNHPSFQTSGLNADQSLSVGTLAGSANGTLVSAAKLNYAPYFVGEAFGGGGYFEAEISFDPDAVDATHGFPAWWMMALEHLANLPGQQWQGQPADYDHFMEVDTFEFNRRPKIMDAYAGTLHDWFGLYKSTCPNGFCKIDTPFATSTKHVPLATDWKSFTHRIGVLWVPATSSSDGSLTFYFDGQQEGDPVRYAKFTNQPPPLTAQTPWTFGVIDQQHMVLILGAGPSARMIVRSVNVWQASAAHNMKN